MAGPASARFHPGDWVQVRVGSPPGHFRTPAYIQGKTGQVRDLCGTFKNPESLAHGGDGRPEQPLYRVEFRQHRVWDHYSGPATDKVLVDIYEHWLNPAEGKEFL